MTNERRVLVHSDSDALAASITARFLTKTVDLLDENDRVNIVLEGGRIAIRVLATINSSPARDSVDWSRVHFWWGDERWLPAGDAERNDVKARAALIDHIDIPAENVHTCPTSDGPLDLDQAAAAYSEELAAHADGDSATPPVRHHVSGRRTGRAHGIAVPRPPRSSGTGGHGRRRTQFPEAASGAAQPHPARHQLVATDLGRTVRRR